MISVVIPVYNMENYIEQTLLSVLSQERADFEVVVVNDGSTDRSGEIIRRYADRIILIEQENIGLERVRNVAIEHAQAELIALLDADDLYLPGHLANLQEFAKKHPEASAFYGDVWLIDPQGKRLWIQKTPKQATLKNLLFGNFIVHSSVIINRRSFPQEKYYQPCGPAADWDLWMRALDHGPLLHYPWIGVEYRKHLESAIHQNQILTEESDLNLLGRIFSRHSELDQKLKNKALAQAYCSSMIRFLAAGKNKEAHARAILSLRKNPMLVKTWLGLAVSLLPKSISQELINLRRKILKWLT